MGRIASRRSRSRRLCLRHPSFCSIIRIAILAILLTTTTIWLQTARVVVGQEDAPRFETDTSYTFGQAMQFSLSAENVPNVDSAILYFRPVYETTVYSIEVPATSDADGSLEVTHGVDLTEVNLAPYSVVTYWWVLEADGNEILVPERSVIYEDDQFNWQRSERAGVTAHWVGEGPFFGQQILDISAETLPALAEVIPMTEIEPFDVYVYPSAADLRAALRLTGIANVDEPHPELGVVLVTAVNPQSAEADLRRSIPYEMAHLMLYRVSGLAYPQLPPWLREGLALSMADSPDPLYAQALDSAVVTQTTLPVAQLCASFPPEPDQAQLAAAQSESFVRFLRTRYGDSAVSSLVSAYVQGANCTDALEGIFRLSVEELEVEWLAAQQPQSALERFLGEVGLWLLLLLAGFGITMYLLLRSRQTASAG